jgi:hypothetical protein
MKTMLISLLGSLGILSSAAASDAMMGDSIALGTGHAMRVSTYAVTGIGSCAFVSHIPVASYENVGISIGINDGGACVAMVRAKVHAKRVVWILPAAINPGRGIVATVAADYHDGTIGYACKGGCSKVNFHPANYATVAKAMRRAWAQH